MVDEEDKLEAAVIDDPDAKPVKKPANEDEMAEAPATEETESESAEDSADESAASPIEATDDADAPALGAIESESSAEDDVAETAAAQTETAADDEPVTEATESETVEALAAEIAAVETGAVVDPGTVETEPAEPPAAAEDKVVAAPVAKKEPASNRRWYVVHAYSGFESYVKKVLESRIATSEHKKKFGEIMVPTEEVVEMREGSRRKSERKFFPGYVLVQMEMDNDTWHLVKQVPKVLGFIGGTSDKPAPISEAEADAILNRVEEGVDKPRPKVLFEVGEVVRVNDGPFNDFNGVVEEVNYEKSKMLVSVQIFGRSTPVELAFGQVEKG